MRVRRFNAISAACSLVGACLLLLFGDPFAAFVWIACSIVWLILAIVYARSPRSVPHPVARITRRLTNLLIWS